MELAFLSSGNLCTIISSENPDIIRIVAMVAFIAFLSIVSTIGVIFYNRISKFKAKKVEKGADDIVLEELNDLFFYDSITEIPEEELDETVSKLNDLKNNDRIFRRSMVKLMVYFQTNLTGSTAQIIRAAYSRLKLREFTLRKLRSSLWYRKTQGLTEVQGMKDGHSLPDVYKLAEDKNPDVRVAAYAVLLKLKADDCFEFLTTEKEELSEWHQIMLEDGIFKTPDLEIPEFRNFLNSENKSIILLCIKLIVDYKQFNAVPKLLSLLDYDDEHVRNQIIIALGKLCAENAEEKLLEQYEPETIKNKAAIILTLGQIGSGRSIEFIKEKFLTAEHYIIYKSAAAAIFAHPEALKDSILSSLDKITKDQKAILKHFAEPLNMYGNF